MGHISDGARLAGIDHVRDRQSVSSRAMPPTRNGDRARWQELVAPFSQSPWKYRFACRHNRFHAFYGRAKMDK